MANPASTPAERLAAGAPVPPPLFVLAMLAASWGLNRVWPMPLPRGMIAVGATIATAIAAALLLGGALVGMRRADTAVEPWAPTTALVTTGVFRVSRNPVYVAFLCVQISVAWGTGNAWMLVLLFAAWLLLDQIQVQREERYLLRKFGDDYAAYRRRVRRWL